MSTFLTLLALGGLIIWAGKEGSEKQRKAEEIAAEEKRRKKSRCKFDDGISEAEFAELANKVAKKIKRIKNVKVSGPLVFCEVESQSGISTWTFSVDFNDYGHISGKYWIESQNKDSIIPDKIGKRISEQLLMDVIPGVKQSAKADSYGSDDDAENDEPAADKNITESPRTKKKRKYLLHFVLFSLSCIAAICLYQYWQESKLIYVGAESTSLHKQSCSAVYELLSRSGFSNIHLEEVCDLPFDQIEHEGELIGVTINGTASFASSDRVPHDAEVVITYHGLKLVSAPVMGKEAKGMNYTEIETAFADAGFVNIVLEPIPDIVLGWFVKDGEVDSVLIEGDHEYSQGTLYRPDAEVRIKYHTAKGK